MSMPMRPWVTNHAHEVFASAHELAERLGHHDVTPLHIMLGFLDQMENLASAVLSQLGVPLDILEGELKDHLPAPGMPRTPPNERSWTPSDERLIDLAKVEADKLGHRHHGSEHLLLAFIRDSTGPTATVLLGHGIGYDDVRAEVIRILST